MQVANIPPNRETADMIRERIKVRNAQINANARIINAKARAWTFAGFGAMVAAGGIGIGIGAAVAFYGYAHASAIRITQQQPVVQTSPGERALTELPPPWHEMDPKGGREPTSNQHQSPGKSARGPDGSHSTSATQDPSSSKTQGVTSKYTVFKSVKHGQGQVSTGWDFEPGDKLPNTQYCYYRFPYKSGTDFVTMLARNGQMLPDIQMPDGMDAAKAAGDCVWFSGATADKKQP